VCMVMMLCPLVPAHDLHATERLRVVLEVAGGECVR
jgi:hypothetical protein